MPIKIDCPRCKTLLQVPGKLAGSYVHCPQCKGRLWVAKDAPSHATPSAPLAVSPPPTAPPADASSGPWAVLRSTLPSVPAPAAPPPAPVPKKKVAHFITADSADSTLRLAADGKLPELHLEDGQAKAKQEANPQSKNPWLLAGVLCMSLLLSVALIWLGGNDQGGAAGTSDKQAIRKDIEKYYFGSGNIESRRLEPYQLLLREAHLAHSRGDYKSEREYYRRVLDLLRAERGTHEKGLTGSRGRDKQLEEALTVLLSGG